jgi:hypothetical protein
MKYYSQFFGIFLGGLYGIGIRILGETDIVSKFFSIYSITFVWITPIVISVIPIFISSNELYKSKQKLFFFPVLTIFLFMIIAFSTGLEDWLCILILSFPFFIVAGITGLVIGIIIKKKITNKKLYSIIFLPFLLNPIENLLPDTSQIFTVENKINIEQNTKLVWKNILEVPEIKDNEYDFGFFNFAGVPRPVKSELKILNHETYRIGYFSDNLKLVETISEIEENKFVNFKIHIDKSQLRDKPTDRHLLKSKFFNFENISYRLKPIDENKTELILSCEYKIDSKMNGYAGFWASNIINDFEVRLLNALKRKLEK